MENLMVPKREQAGVWDLKLRHETIHEIKRRTLCVRVPLKSCKEHHPVDRTKPHQAIESRPVPFHYHFHSHIHRVCDHHCLVDFGKRA
jgi:hypothetical protein